MEMQQMMTDSNWIQTGLQKSTLIVLARERNQIQNKTMLKDLKDLKDYF